MFEISSKCSWKMQPTYKSPSVTVALPAADAAYEVTLLLVLSRVMLLLLGPAIAITPAALSAVLLLIAVVSAERVVAMLLDVAVTAVVC